MNRDDLNALLRSGIEAARNNNNIIARSTFRQVLDEEPDNELAWMWLAQVVDMDSERREALQQVLRINPENERARDALRRLGGTVPQNSAEQAASASSIRSRANAPSTPARPSGGQNVVLPTPQRRSNEVWSTNRGNRRNNNTIVTLLLILVAIVMIIGGLLLLIGRITDTSAELTTTAEQALGGSPTGDTVTPIPPTSTSAGPTSPPFGDDDLTIDAPPSTFTPTVPPPPSATPSPTAIPDEPDDRFELVYLDRSGNLGTIRSDGSGRSSLDYAVGDGSPATFGKAATSPDGSSIAFSARVSGVEEIYIASLTTSDVRQVTSLGSANTTDPDWSPDGEQLTFASDADGDWDIYIVSAEGDTPVKITQNTDYRDRMPAWSPDGSYIAYVSGQNSNFDNEIYAIEPDTSSDRGCQLTDSPRNSYAPAWSPDGQHIAFISDRTEDESDIYVMTFDGGAETLISGNDGGAVDSSVDWSPDGRWLAISTTRQIDSSTPRVFPTDDPDVILEVTRTPVPTVSPGAQVARLWLYDVDYGLWYRISDDAVNSPVYVPDGSSITVDPIVITCS